MALLLRLFLLTFFSLPFSQAWADNYSETITVFKNAGESGKYFKKSYGYAVFPTIGKAGFGLGGAHGKGRVYKKGNYVGDTSMTQVTFGLQLGGRHLARSFSSRIRMHSTILPVVSLSLGHRQLQLQLPLEHLLRPVLLEVQQGRAPGRKMQKQKQRAISKGCLSLQLRKEG